MRETAGVRLVLLVEVPLYKHLVYDSRYNVSRNDGRLVSRNDFSVVLKVLRFGAREYLSQFGHVQPLSFHMLQVSHHCGYAAGLVREVPDRNHAPTFAVVASGVAFLTAEFFAEVLEQHDSSAVNLVDAVVDTLMQILQALFEIGVRVGIRTSFFSAFRHHLNQTVFVLGLIKNNTVGTVAR